MMMVMAYTSTISIVVDTLIVLISMMTPLNFPVGVCMVVLFGFIMLIIMGWMLICMVLVFVGKAIWSFLVFFMMMSTCWTVMTSNVTCGTMASMQMWSGRAGV